MMLPLAISTSLFLPLRFFTQSRTTTATSNPNEYDYGGPKKISTSGRRWTIQKLTRVSSSENRTVVITPATTTTLANDESLPVSSVKSASDVVRNFYGGINCHDVASVEDLISENCIYEDLIFPRPFVGRKAILEFFKKFIDSISMDLQFVIDDISNEDTSAVGVTWHLEWKGKPFPFSKGCSFYRLDVVNGQRQIIYGRDCVEPAIKPGETTLVGTKVMTSSLHQKLKFTCQLGVGTIHGDVDPGSDALPILEIQHGCDDISLTGFNHVGSLEIEHMPEGGFYKDSILQIMKLTGYVPGKGLSRHLQGLPTRPQ